MPITLKVQFDNAKDPVPVTVDDNATILAFITTLNLTPSVQAPSQLQYVNSDNQIAQITQTDLSKPIASLKFSSTDAILKASLTTPMLPHSNLSPHSIEKYLANFKPDSKKAGGVPLAAAGAYNHIQEKLKAEKKKAVDTRETQYEAILYTVEALAKDPQQTISSPLPAIANDATIQKLVVTTAKAKKDPNELLLKAAEEGDELVFRLEL